MLYCDLDEEIYRDKIKDFHFVNKIINALFLFFIFLISYKILNLL